jgi:hypothetical protein
MNGPVNGPANVASGKTQVQPVASEKKPGNPYVTAFLPHVIVVVGFMLAIALYFSPLVFNGYNLKQGDAQNWAGSAQEITKFREQYSQEPLWTNGMFAGMPAYTISVIYAGEVIGYAENVMRLGLPYPANILLVALICYYILMLALGHKPPLAALGAVAFTFFTFSLVSIEAGHNSKVRAMAMAPLFLAGMVLMFRDKRWLGMGLAALGMGLQIHAGHYQVTYYLAMFCFFMGLGYLLKAIQEKKIAAFAIQCGLLVLAVAIGVGANAGRLLQLQEYAGNSMRGKSELTAKAKPAMATAAAGAEAPKDGGLARDYVFNWSNQIKETMTLLVPGFMGGSSQEPVTKKGAVATQLRTMNVEASQLPTLPYYWGDQPFTSGPVYAGAIVLFLCVLAVALLPFGQTFWLLLAIAFSIMLSWGKNFPQFNFAMYDSFPAYRQFRSVTMAIVIAQWALPWLATLGLARFLAYAQTKPLGTLPDMTISPELKKKAVLALQIAAGSLGLVLIALWLSPSLAGDFTSPNDDQLPAELKQQLYSAIQDDRSALLSSDSMRSIGFILFAAGLLFAYTRGWLKANIVVPAMVLLCLADLWQVNQRYLNKGSFERNYYQQQFLPSAADQRMMTLPYGSYRVLNLQNPFGDSKTSYFHQSLGGYSPVKLRRYQDLIEGPLSAQMQNMVAALQAGGQPDSALALAPVVNMLNARFVKFGDAAEQVLDNPLACGNAWFVSSVHTVYTPDEEYLALSQNFNPRREAIVDLGLFPQFKQIKGQNFDTTGARATLTEYRSNKLTYDLTTPKEGLLVLSENYYPVGWEALLDGKPVELFRADYTLRALLVPAGKHTLVCSFNPPSFALGNAVSAGASLAIFGLLGYVAIAQVRSRKSEEKGSDLA